MSSNSGDWLNHGGDIYNQRHAHGESKISPSTVSNLSLKYKSTISGVTTQKWLCLASQKLLSILAKKCLFWDWAQELGLVKSRDELFITSKLWGTDCHPQLVLPTLQKTLRELKLEYVKID
ncbi:unnamed protein product [Camellia sinensis]